MAKISYGTVLLSAILLAMGTGCEKKEDTAKREEMSKTQATEISSVSMVSNETRYTEAKTPTQENVLSRIGIEKHGDKIVIDLNRTQAYMQQMANKLKKKSEEIRDTMQKGAVRIKEAGIDINDKYVHIDINKTEKALQSWMKDMEALSKELQESVEEIAKDLNASGLTAPQTP